MNYTTNYHLPQWVKSDRIMMDDFNDAMSAMEDGMTASTQTANAAASTANTAHALAAAAKQTADAAYSPGQKPFTVGSYTGTGETLTVTLGFRPSFVIITPYHGADGIGVGAPAMLTDATLMNDRITFTDTGFRLAAATEVLKYSPRVNHPSVHYVYIAFK